MKRLRESPVQYMTQQEPTTELSKRERWFQWERSTHDKIVIKRVYIDMLEGDIVAAILLSQIVYWFTPTKEGKSRLRVNRDGRMWLAKQYSDWYEECRLTGRQAQRALEKLRDMGLVETAVYQFRRFPTVHIYLLIEKLMDTLDIYLPKKGLSDESTNEDDEE